MEFVIADYLGNYNKATGRGNCKGCDTSVSWKRTKVASHKRANCSAVTAAEKEIFRIRTTSSNNSEADISMQSDDSGPYTLTPMLTVERKAEIDGALAMLCFRTGVPFRFINSDVFRHFVELLNPEYAREMPRAKTVSGILLDKQYTKTAEKLRSVLDNSNNLTLISDGWTNCRGDHIVNFLVKGPGQPSLFVKSMNTTGITQDAAGIADAVGKVLNELGAAKFVSFVSDNAPVMKAAHDEIEERFPHISAFGCAAHVLNLLVKDILEPHMAGKENILAQFLCSSF